MQVVGPRLLCRALCREHDGCCTATAFFRRRAFDLEGMRTKLDDIGLKVAEHQEESMQNRRKLAEATREFKKNSEAVSKTVGPLLKQYQAREPQRAA